MSKQEQLQINAQVEKAINDFNSENAMSGCEHRLRTCTATVFEQGNYYVLRSYNTIVAIIDKRTDTLYDFLRLVYGYTSTSAQHISKFEKDYCQGKWNCEHHYTYRAV